MSKIPQGEWNAIAARYAQGESISKIAQSYGCTPPAIHYILKRGRQRPAHNFEQPAGPAPIVPAPQCAVQLPAQAPAPEIATRAEPPAEHRNGERPAMLDRPGQPIQPLPSRDRAVTPGHTVQSPPSHDRTVAPIRPAANGRFAPLAAPTQSGSARASNRASAFTAGLDDELHGRAEAAIAAFRSSFDAALAEGSPLVRQRLRQAASDLMRVAARTTIVLDRLNASAEHSSGPVENYFRR